MKKPIEEYFPAESNTYYILGNLFDRHLGQSMGCRVAKLEAHYMTKEILDRRMEEGQTHVHVVKEHFRRASVNQYGQTTKKLEIITIEEAFELLKEFDDE